MGAATRTDARPNRLALPNAAERAANEVLALVRASLLGGHAVPMRWAIELRQLGRDSVAEAWPVATDHETLFEVAELLGLGPSGALCAACENEKNAAHWFLSCRACAALVRASVRAVSLGDVLEVFGRWNR